MAVHTIRSLNQGVNLRLKEGSTSAFATGGTASRSAVTAGATQFQNSHFRPKRVRALRNGKPGTSFGPVSESKAS